MNYSFGKLFEIQIHSVFIQICEYYLALPSTPSYQYSLIMIIKQKIVHTITIHIVYNRTEPRFLQPTFLVVCCVTEVVLLTELCGCLCW